jgi:hypothetical protein
VNYLIASLLLLFTCVSGFADQVNQPNLSRRSVAKAEASIQEVGHLFTSHLSPLTNHF